MTLKPFEERCPRCEAPWPRLIPAGSCFCWSTTLDAGHGTRDSKTRLATLALDGLYFIHPDAPERKGEFTECR